MVVFHHRSGLVLSLGGEIAGEEQAKNLIKFNFPRN